MEVGLAVGGAFLSSALNVLFDRLAPHGDLLDNGDVGKANWSPRLKRSFWFN
uniref:Uncharacterized protein n=1 Tax=Solanum lycopersicum TaxID=4081 RepID=A0A3Q7IW58_SOLLC